MYSLAEISLLKVTLYSPESPSLRDDDMKNLK